MIFKIMKKLITCLSFTFFSLNGFAQFFSTDPYENSQIMLIDAYRQYAETMRDISQKVAVISRQVQPYRESMQKSFAQKDYINVINTYYKAIEPFYYQYEHRATVDMALLAGECAEIIEDIPLAIKIYKRGGQPDMTYFTPRLNSISSDLLSKAEKLISERKVDKARDLIYLAEQASGSSSRSMMLNAQSYEVEGIYDYALYYYKICAKNKFFGAKEAVKRIKAIMKSLK